MRRSDKIAALEKEVAWYKEECVMQKNQIAQLAEDHGRVRGQAEDSLLQVRELEHVLSKY
jgi:hypothetical protein